MRYRVYRVNRVGTVHITGMRFRVHADAQTSGLVWSVVWCVVCGVMHLGRCLWHWDLNHASEYKCAGKETAQFGFYIVCALKEK